MDKKDVGSISIAVAFHKKWWDKHRASKIKGTGTGALLDRWRKSNLAGVLSLDGLKLAYADCDELKKSLQKAKGLCGPTEADDAKGIDKMLDLLANHRESLDKRKARIEDLAKGIKKMVDQIASCKPELNKLAKEFAQLQLRHTNAENASAMDLSEEDKKQLLKNVGLLAAAQEKLRLELDALANQAKALQNSSEGKQVLMAAQGEKDLRGALTTLATARAGFEDICSELYDRAQMLQTQTIELEKDIAGTATTQATLKLLETQLVMLTDSPMFQGWFDISDKARHWTPKIEKARKNLKAVSEKDWKEFVGLVPELETGARQAEGAAAQIARILTLSRKSAERFKNDVQVKQAITHIEEVAKKRLTEREQFKKVFPPLLFKLKDLVEQR